MRKSRRDMCRKESVLLLTGHLRKPLLLSRAICLEKLLLSPCRVSHTTEDSWPVLKMSRLFLPVYLHFVNSLFSFSVSRASFCVAWVVVRTLASMSSKSVSCLLLYVTMSTYASIYLSTFSLSSISRSFCLCVLSIQVV